MSNYTEEVQAYIEELYSRREEAVMAQRYEMEGGEWQPELNKCHDNVDIVVHNMEGYSAVRGWLYFPLVNLFVQHSLLQAPDSTLMEITPSEASQEYPFIQSHESDKVFFAMFKHTDNGKLYFFE